MVTDSGTSLNIPPPNPTSQQSGTWGGRSGPPEDGKGALRQRTHWSHVMLADMRLFVNEECIKGLDFDPRGKSGE